MRSPKSILAAKIRDRFTWTLVQTGPRTFKWFSGTFPMSIGYPTRDAALIGLSENVGPNNLKVVQDYTA